MAGTAGYGGSARFQGNVIIGCKSWSIDQEANILEITDFDSSGLREYTVGIQGWSATVDCSWSASNTFTVGDEATLRLQYDATTAVSGTGIVSSIGDSVDVDGVISSSVSFQGTSTLPV